MAEEVEEKSREVMISKIDETYAMVIVIVISFGITIFYHHHHHPSCTHSSPEGLPCDKL